MEERFEADPNFKEKILSLVKSIEKGKLVATIPSACLMCTHDRQLLSILNHCIDITHQLFYYTVFSTDTSIDLPAVASDKSADEVANFLDKIGLSEYAETFKDADISGEVLLDADSEMLSELSVSSSLHQMRIMQLFNRELLGATPTYSRDHLNQFLQDNKLDKYASKLEENGIDGDMIVNVDSKIMKVVFKEIGITSAVDIAKICSKYKKFVSS